LDNILNLISGNPAAIIIAIVVILSLIFVLILITLLRKSRSKIEKTEMNTDKIPPQKTDEKPTPAETFGLSLVDENGKVKKLEKLPVLIGRDRQNEIVFMDSSVSARHARIYYDEIVGVCIEDLGSLNGLYLNGQPTRKNVLQDGVKITIGNITLTFQDTGYIHPGSI
jgi:pSer/pThr/pTyr-binding forkhead associated (FHA) protein